MEQIIILQDIDCIRSDIMSGAGIYGLIRRSQFSRPIEHEWNKHVAIVGNSLCSSVIVSVNFIAICNIFLLN